MKQIIPFKKELPFKTKVSEITSISLERDIDIKEEGLISGIFHVSGDYKMNEGSITRENYSFDLPFDITLDPRYDTSKVECDIEDFYYDVVNEDTLKVNIDLFVEAEYKEEPVVENMAEDNNDRIKEPDELEDTEEYCDTATELEEELVKEPEKVLIEEITVDDTLRDEVVDLDTDLFSNLDSTETYTTYYVYIVKEEDTVDKILSKYEITKEDFEDYNDINNIKPGDKVIIPKKGA